MLQLYSKYEYHVFQMGLLAGIMKCEMNPLCSIACSIIYTWLFHGKMHSDWFNRLEIFQSRWQHGEKVGYCYPSGLEKTLYKWDTYVPLVTKGLTEENSL
jgi:hypothetical protein